MLLRYHLNENVKLALQMLRSYKLRSVLTIIGVVIGVWTVMTIASVVSGVDHVVKREIESWGTHTIFIYKYNTELRTSEPTREERMRKDLNYDDSVAIAQLPAVKVAVPFLNISNDYFGNKILVARGGVTSAAVRLYGTIPEYDRTGLRVIKAGRWFTQFENSTHQQVCVISHTVEQSFFANGSALDQTLKIGGKEFRVRGVFEKRERLFGSDINDDRNNVIFIPFEVGRKLKPNSTDIDIVAIAHPGMMDEAMQQIEDLLRVRRQVPFDLPNDFSMQTAKSLTENFRAITFAVNLIMIALSSVGLIVGGIGVMNIMLVSVTERASEIGMRRAIGACRRDILWQFLIEAMSLTGVGGIIGLAAGWATALLVNYMVPSYVPLWAPVAGFVASVGIGLIFGFWPAWKAARLDPIEALRFE
jgi:putative ABC transport system permease protein